MSNAQKKYTLALGKCTGEFTIAYDFNGPSNLRRGSVTINEIYDQGIINNTYYLNNGSKSSSLVSKENIKNVFVNFTNNFSHTISVVLSFSDQVINESVEPHQTKKFTLNSNEYNINWLPISRPADVSKSIPNLTGSIAVTWDDVSLNSGDTNGAGSLVLVKDKEQPITGNLFITAPDGLFWSVYLDCPACEGGGFDSDSDTESESGSESDTESESGSDGGESSDSDSESESESDSGSESDSDSCCALSEIPADAGAIFNPNEYMHNLKECQNFKYDVDMSMPCSGPGCRGGNPPGSRVHIADFTPELNDQYYQSLIDSCTGTAYGPFPLRANAKSGCDASSIGQGPTGQDVAGVDMEEYASRAGNRNYCPVNQQALTGSNLYMIGTDGNGGCVPIPMKYVICNGCTVGFGAAGENCDGDSDSCPESDSDSESDLPPVILPPAPLPPEQVFQAIPAQPPVLNPFNPPVPQIGNGQLVVNGPRPIDVVVGKANPNRQLDIQQAEDDCSKANVVFTFTGNTKSQCPLKSVKAVLKINNQERATKTWSDNNPADAEKLENGGILDWSEELKIGKQDQGNYNYEVTLTPMDGVCPSDPVIENTQQAPINVTEETNFTKCQVCGEDEKQIAVYCDGTLAEPMPEEEDLCYYQCAFLKVPGTETEDILSGQQLTNNCGDGVTATLVKREHISETGSGDLSPTGCAKYSLTYFLTAEKLRPHSTEVTLTIPARGEMYVFASGEESIILRKEPIEYNIGSQHNVVCSDYQVTTTLPPSSPSTTTELELDRTGSLIRETIVGGAGSTTLTFKAGTKFFFENGVQVMCNINMNVIPVGGMNDPTAPGNQFSMPGGGGWLWNGPGAILQIATWDQGGMGNMPVGQNREGEDFNASAVCQPMKVDHWNIPADLKVPVPNIDPQKAAAISQAVQNNVISLFKLNRNTGIWDERGGLGFNGSEFTAQMSTASTWNVDSKAADTCSELRVYPPSNLLNSRQVNDDGPLQAFPDWVGPQAVNKGRAFTLNPGIGIRQTVDNPISIAHNMVFDRIETSWPIRMAQWPKRDVQGNVVVYNFEFYDPSQPGSPTIGSIPYSNDEPGITPLCVINTDTACKIGNINKQYKGGGSNDRKNGGKTP